MTQKDDRADTPVGSPASKLLARQEAICLDPAFAGSPRVGGIRVQVKDTFLTFAERSPQNADSPVSSKNWSPRSRSLSDVTNGSGGKCLRQSSFCSEDGDVVQGEYLPRSASSTWYMKPRQAGQEGESTSILDFSPPTADDNSDTFPNFRLGMVLDSQQDRGRSPLVMTPDLQAEFELVMEEGTTNSRVPKLNCNGYSREERSDATVSSKSSQDVTTIMLRNIPNKYTQRMVLDVINSMGFKDLYDFFYLPIDFKNKCNVGYAFVNFMSGSQVTRFTAVFNGYKLPGFNSNKICCVSPARVQGLSANIEHYSNSPVSDITVPEYRPLLFCHGQEIPFPQRSAGAR